MDLIALELALFLFEADAESKGYINHSNIPGIRLDKLSNKNRKWHKSEKMAATIKLTNIAYSLYYALARQTNL